MRNLHKVFKVELSTQLQKDLLNLTRSSAYIDSNTTQQPEISIDRVDFNQERVAMMQEQED